MGGGGESRPNGHSLNSPFANGRLPALPPNSPFAAGSSQRIAPRSERRTGSPTPPTRRARGLPRDLRPPDRRDLPPPTSRQRGPYPPIFRPKTGDPTPPTSGARNLPRRSFGRRAEGPTASRTSSLPARTGRPRTEDRGRMPEFLPSVVRVVRVVRPHNRLALSTRLCGGAPLRPRATNRWSLGSA